MYSLSTTTRTRRIALLGVASLATGLLGVLPGAALAEPADPADPGTAATPPTAGAARERVADRLATLPRLTTAQRAARRAAAERSVQGEGAGFGTPLVLPTSYPSQPTLAEPEPEPLGQDASTLSGVLAHSDLAPQVNDWMADSDLVSAQVVGQSVQGRDLYLVTLTAPETEAETAQQEAWKDEIRNDPTAAADDAALAAGYKAPIWFSANIHGNEWEGTDGIMGYIGDLLDAEDEAATQTLMAEHRLYFYLTINPDGRTIGQRPGVLGLDINRDMITSTTPEAVAFAKVAQQVQPLYSADLHGYTNVLQVEPCGPPHGDNYEYDLFIGHGYAAALQVEEEMLDALIPGNPLPFGQITIPYRDTPSGWDDYPPVFTAQYTAYYGAVTSTVELPLPRAGTTQTPVTSAINTAVATQTIESLVDYVTTNTDDMLANQIEVFRRGVVGAPKVQLTGDNIAAVPGPDEWKELWDAADDQNPVEYPRAYVIPRGDDQRSQSDADRVVAHLLFNQIEVGTLDAATTVDGTTYPAGSYVVDMHQPLRGLANALLDVGYDISEKVPSMYDVSAWSYSSLWGASVDPVGVTTDPSIGAATPIDSPTPAVAAPAVSTATTFDLAGVADFRALNDLLEAGGEARMAPNGSVVVAAGSYDEAVAAAAAQDVDLRAASAAEVTAAGGEGARTLADLSVGFTGTQDDTLSLTELGFDDLVPVTGAAITADPSILDDLDVLWVGAALGLTAGSAGDEAVQAWVDEGHSIVGRGTAGLAAAEDYGLLSADAVTGISAGNGIVALDTPEGSPLAPYAQDSSFIYPAVTFTDLGEGTEVAQGYAADTFLAGHWAGSTGTNGPDFAAGKAAVISSEVASGARALVFGTSIFFRSHPKGGLGQGGRALFWAASTAPTPLPVPRPTTVSLSQVGTTTYPEAATVRVEVVPDEGAGLPAGDVVVVDRSDRVLATATLADGAARLTLPGRRPGAARLRAGFIPADDDFAASATRTVSIVTDKVGSSTRTKVQQLGKRRIRLVTSTSARHPDVPVKGRVHVLVDKEPAKSFRLKPADGGVHRLKLRLSPGLHRIQVVYTGSGLVEASKSRNRKARARR
ncbi:MAG: M14 family zinc carboxypeptidase [Nocardioides sp.]|uniref:M14 family zinc carboxypeptidase n=1 Tax=Nocardioides sp. TaxID=35761 RepID=UPI002384DF4D|nr:M14 family zinc carboxypeptidase [Nocardioides sp.]MDE0776510.1 M14 family zinc carboxypeptidase [Nocardioides sp.]